MATMDNSTWTPVRVPVPAEGRLIARHMHKFYNNLLVAGIYKFQTSTPSTQLTQVETYVQALEACVRHHPFLSVVLKKDTTGKDVFARVSHIDFRNHFHVINSGAVSDDEDARIARILEHLSNDTELTFFETYNTLPGWRIDVLPMNNVEAKSRIFISFTYSHYIGDGMSGIAFHKSFLRELRQSFEASIDSSNTVIKTSAADLPMLPHLPVSLLYLLGPALGHYLPSFVAKALGLKASASGSDAGTWTGPDTFLNSTASSPPVTTAVEIISIDADMLRKVLGACRKHDAKLTSLLNEIIAACLSRHLPGFHSLVSRKDNFISSTPTNIRKLVGMPDDTIGIFASAEYSRHDINPGLVSGNEVAISDDMWSAARTNAEDIAKGASTLLNQPIALLAWISDLNGWMSGQLNKPRDATWQLSNLMSFDGRAAEGDGDVEVEKMYFCQPADAVGQPLDFNVISVLDGELVICAGWQVGAHDLDKQEGKSIEHVERLFVRRILDELKQYLKTAASS